MFAVYCAHVEPAARRTATSNRTDHPTKNLACIRSPPKMESQHLQNKSTVNVFSIDEIYIPPGLRCQAVSSTFVLTGLSETYPGVSGPLLRIFDQPRLRRVQHLLAR